MALYTIGKKSFTFVNDASIDFNVHLQEKCTNCAELA